MQKLVLSLVLSLVFMVSQVFGDAQYLQDISVMVSSGNSSGSGVVVTREVKLKTNEETVAKVNFVWTAGHVVEGQRTVRTFIDPTLGTEKKSVEFKPVFIVKPLNEGGRKVGDIRMESKVLRYSDANTGHDLALLMVLKKDFVDASAKFHLEETITPIGTEIFHVGSLLGADGANSLTKGIVSQVGRVLDFNNGNTKVFDQSTAPAFPGSSGGGMFTENDEYIGMLVRGAETFNFMVPVRRMKDWATENNLVWALDESVPVPSLEEIEKMTSE